MTADIAAYERALTPDDRAICERLRARITAVLPDAEGRVWHGHPVWFLADNPVVGYAKQAKHVQLLFWSGQSFTTPGLAAEGKFKAAAARLTNLADLDETRVDAWLAEARTVQWDYKNLVKRRGKLERLA